MTQFTKFLALIGTAGSSACIFPSGLCENETRSVSVTAALAAPGGGGATGSATLLLYEARRGEGHASAEQSVLYGVNSTLVRTTVSAVHLHAGTAAAPGRILYDFPLVAGGAESNITVVYTREPYQGPVEFRELFAAVAGTPTVVDVHVGGAAGPALIGAATRETGPASWGRANCS